jgi:glycosyltransferase involved in cell wall biosynthesis
MSPLPPPIERKVRKAYRRLVFSRFAERMLHDAGLDCHYIPHGIDTKVYKPMDRDEVKTKLGVDGRFVVGMVAANKGWPSRKSFPECIEAFSRFHKRHPDSILHLHTVKGEHGEGEGVNLPELCTYHGLELGKSVQFPDQYQLLIGYSDEYMNALYNSFDVLLSPSMGEGFGIPIIEAQAAGCPVIVGDWTAMSELCLSGWKIAEKDATPIWTTLAANQYIPHVAAIDDALETAYKQATTMRVMAAKRAKIYDADRVMEKYWKPALKEIGEGVDAWQASA